jgi:uncharacterized protein (DUF1015 family)
MAKIFPLRGIHYNTEIIKNLNEVLTPPYDNIPAGEEKKFWDRSPYNFAHVDLPLKDEDDYSEATATLTKWIEHKILSTDKNPGYYWYRQIFPHEGTQHSRDALVCTVQLADFSEGIVRPHENTHGKAKKDRLQSIRKTGFNLSHIFGMVKDPDGFLNGLMERWEFQTPLLQGTTDDGAHHAVWRLDADKVPELEAFFSSQPIYIVDGHHRYESALAYAREVGAYGKESHPASRTLFTICNAFEPGLVVLPTHRGVKTLGSTKTLLNNLHESFDLVPLTVEGLKTFCSKPVTTPTFAVGWEDKLYLCTPKHWENAAHSMGKALYKLPMHWSDRKILSETLLVPESDFGHRIQYEKDALKLWNERAKYDFLVFHARPKITDVTDVADEKAFMPPKSTYFYPKLASGLVLRHLS